MLKQSIEKMSRLTRKSLSERTWDDIEHHAFKSLSEELTSTLALESIKLDPYWPKWNSPWWKALLLSEAGKAYALISGYVSMNLKLVRKWNKQNAAR